MPFFYCPWRSLIGGHPVTAKELREQRNTLVVAGQAVINKAEKEDRGLTAEDQAEIGRIHGDARDLGTQIDLVEKQEAMVAEMAQIPACLKDAAGDGASLVPAGLADTKDALALKSRQGFARWCNTGNNNGLPSIKAPDDSGDPGEPGIVCRLPCFASLGADPLASRYDQIMNAMSVGQDTAGGFLVPEGFIRSLEIALLAFGGMRNVSTLLRTSTGEPLPWPTTDDTSNEGTEVSENAELSTTGTDVSIGSVVLNAYSYTSQFVRVSRQLLRDSAFNMETLLGQMLGERLGRIQNRRFTTGDGASKPKGIVEDATLGRTAAVATAFTADDFIRLIHSVDPAYRVSPSTRFMMHDTIFLEMSLLKDGNGNYLLRPGLETGSPDTIRGFQVQINQHMSSAMTTGQKVSLFGDMSKYVIREVGSMVLLQARERFIEFSQVAFLGFMDFDGKLIDAGTNPVKYLALA